MKNREKYAEQIKNYEGNDFCRDFVKPNILKTKKCDLRCSRCHLLQSIWLSEEYTEPEVDWSQVAVDTPILVRDFDVQTWTKRHFAKYIDGKVFVWNGGKTSYSVDSVESVTSWKHAKLAEGVTNANKKENIRTT